MSKLLPQGFLFALALSSGFLFCGRQARASSPQRVELVRADEMDWAEGRRAVEDELSASGYTVEHAESDALDVGVLLDGLAAGASPETAARVTVLRLGRTGIAYVWLLGSDRTYRVTSGEPDPVRAANVLSLRVVELIDLRAAGTDEVPAEPPPRQNDAPPSPERPDRGHLEKSWILLGGAGLTFGDGLTSPLGSLELFVGRRVVRLLGVGATFSLGLNRPSRNLEGATISAGRKRGAVGLLLWSHDSPFWQVGADTGIECYQFSWSGPVGEGDRSACTPSSSVFARTGVEWENFAVWGAGALSLAHRDIRILGADQELASFGRPEATLSGGVGWTF